MQDLLQRQHEITNYLESQAKADEVFYVTVKSMLELCSHAYEIFESSNITMKDGKARYSLQSPFHELVELTKNEEWWRGHNKHWKYKALIYNNSQFSI